LSKVHTQNLEFAMHSLEEGFHYSLTQLGIAPAGPVEIGNALLGRQFQNRLKNLFRALVKLAHGMEQLNYYLKHAPGKGKKRGFVRLTV